MQTRKWEKDGVERYTTEIVLQKFRGELQMLDARGQGEGGGRSIRRRRSRRWSDFGQSGPGEAIGRAAAAAAAGRRIVARTGR